MFLKLSDLLKATARASEGKSCQMTLNVTPFPFDSLSRKAVGRAGRGRWVTQGAPV